MLQFRKKIMISVLCAGLLLTTSQNELSQAAENTSAVQTENQTDGAENGSDSGESSSDSGENAAAEKAPITQEQALSEMKEYAKTSALSLMVNEQTGVFAVKNLSNGSVVWSNPYNADSDSYIKSPVKLNELKSSMIINSVKVSDVETPSTMIRSANDGETTVEKIDGGFKGIVNFPAQGITVPYYVTLTDDHFDISVALDEVHEVELDSPENIDDATRSIVDLGLFANLNAAYADEEGYFVIPDGSGAVINFNNGKSGSSEYSQKIYGRNYALTQDSAPKKAEQAYLPILGFVKKDSALLEVVTEGAAYATAKASIAGQKATGYNSAYFEFSVRSSDQYFMGAVNASALKAYEQSRIPENRLSVRYYPIGKEGASYADIAKRYQKYLLDEGLMTKKVTSEIPLYIDLYGGTVKEQSVMGLPVKLETAATTYSQAKTILEELRSRGIDQMTVTYNDFNKAGITSRISNSVGYSGTLGGKNSFKSLYDYCAAAGITLAPSFELMEFERSGNGYSKTGASVIGVTKAYATQQSYELAFGTPDDLRASWFILSPYYYNKVYGEVLSSCSTEGLNAAAFSEGTSMLYSDFRQNADKKTSRQQAVENLKQCYEMVNSSGIKFVASACNDYALKYVDCIRNVPLYSSNFDLSDYDIPFYEMVIHGYIPYTSKAKNASAGSDELLLLSLATGTPLHYEFMYENPNELNDCEYEKLFYAYYEGWLNSAAEDYRCFAENASGVIDSPIDDFRYLSEKVVECTFENGTVITADLENYTLKINGKSVQLPEKSWKGASID